MSIEISGRELENAYVQLRGNGSSIEGPQGYLLLFYSAECGLKAAVLRNLGAGDTSKLTDFLRTHDLRRLAKELRMSDNEYFLQKCRRRSGVRPSVEAHQLHEAWRYGAQLEARDEQEAVKAIRAMIEWCREALGK